MKPKYLAKMVSAVNKGLIQLNGNRLLVELLSEGEKTTASGIVVGLDKSKLHMEAADRARVAVVLVVGAGYAVEKTATEADCARVPNIHPGELFTENVDLDYKPGDHILVNQFGVKTFGEFFGLPEYKDGSVGLITDDLVQGKLPDFDYFHNLMKKA